MSNRKDHPRLYGTPPEYPTSEMTVMASIDGIPPEYSGDVAYFKKVKDNRGFCSGYIIMSYYQEFKTNHFHNLTAERFHQC
jgi:hypothetical protein